MNEEGTYAKVGRYKLCHSKNVYILLGMYMFFVADMREVIRSIDTKFGNFTDDLEIEEQQAGSSALGALNRIWNYLKTQSTAGIVEVVNNIKSLLGNANPTESNTNTVMNFLHLINNKSPIKSIQRGVAVGGNDDYLTITIEFVNPSKCMVLLDGEWSYRALDGGHITVPYLVSITNTELTIGGARREYTRKFSWQVIEFN